MYKTSKQKILVVLGLILCAIAVFWNVQALGERKKTQVQQTTVEPSLAREWIKEGKQLESIPGATWEQLLDKNAFHILWDKGTERAFTGELLNEKREGVFVSAGCRIPVFKSEHKFKSGTGWPSFWEVFDKDNIILKEDRSWGMRRVEVLSKCGEHLGHLFDDGPDPTGLRYCINSAALAFIPKGEADKLGPFSLK